MYVCLCNGVTDTDILAAVDSGATTLDAVVLATRAGSRCGTCRTEIAQMVEAISEGRSPAPRACCRDDGKRHLTVHDERSAA